MPRVPTKLDFDRLRRIIITRLALSLFECQIQFGKFEELSGGHHMKLKPLGDRLIVKAVEEEATTASGIVLPDTAKEKPQKGKVLAVGDGKLDDDGKRIPLDVSEGDEVLYSKYGGTEITVEGEDLLVLRESDVLAKVQS
jgi:chaperonin GroES